VLRGGFKQGKKRGTIGNRGQGSSALLKKKKKKKKKQKPLETEKSGECGSRRLRGKSENAVGFKCTKMLTRFKRGLNRNCAQTKTSPGLFRESGKVKTHPSAGV